MKSIQYYDDNPKRFIDDTYNADMSKHHEVFEKYIKDGGSVLDLGCGSGRDSLHFSSRGYDVTSLDGSEQMVKFCRTTLTNTVVHATFESYTPEQSFDGIWACASLLHVERTEIENIIRKYINHLQPNGIFYMSFKNHSEDFDNEGRYFTCFDKIRLEKLFSQINEVEIINLTETLDVRNSKGQWISAIIRKVN